ncbi:3-hydroxyisobutyrate dehydrogenase-like beta-hydroxyacid dehydrogenase [Salinibacterium sp. CAN_S4]|uniref:NAD(P)-dependent oxidoreductase n=1 Tax=Salinibacterium sp. CAN_S4 TaxID=2787727 RepID=UPI0018EF7780
MTTVGFIGLGAMGATMARRLIDAGHEVVLFNRSAAAVDALVEAGGSRAENAEEAVATGLVFSMLPHDAAAEAVFTADLLATAPAGTVHVSFATLSVAAADRLESLHSEAGVQYVSAPVLGRPNVAEAGQLNIVAGGPSSAIARAQELLDVLGKHTWVVSETPSAANLVKIGVNYNLVHTIQALAESVTLVERGGIDAGTFVDILTDTAYTGTAYAGYGRMIAAREYPPLFTVALGLKDLTLAEQAAAATGVALPTAPVLHELLEQALADPELSQGDWSSMAEITRLRSTQA